MAQPRTAAVLFLCMTSALVIAAGGDGASAAPSGTPLQLTGISPAAGPLGGGNQVTVRTSDAAAVTSVDFGGATSTQVNPVKAHLLQVIVPAHAGGTVDVVLHSASATSPVTPAGRYEFVTPPDPLTLQVSKRLGRPLGIGLLDAIGCTVHNFCAVEMRNRAGHVTALATFGDGHRPRVQSLPDKPLIARPGCNGFCPDFESLVACGTPRFCVAGNGRYERVWNGHRWGGPHRLSRSRADVVSCAPGTTLCVLGGRHSALVHGRHGWRILPFPKRFSYPTSLSCATARFCLARALGPSARFDGSSWHAVRTPLHFPRDVGCASAHYCLAVGEFNAKVFDGTGWHAVADPPIDRGVQAISCVAVRHCIAQTGLAAEVFNDGHWTTSAAPLKLTGFSCVPRGRCWATLGNGQALRFEHSRWTNAKNITPYHDELSDISCASPTWCMAVSRSGEAFRYSGSAWSREGHVDGRHRLQAISCTADQTCVAVDGAIGTEPTGIRSGGRAVRYSNGRWQRPSVIDTRHRLIDISCASAEHCVAVDIDGRAVTFRRGTWSDPKPLASAQPRNHYTDAIDCPTVHYCAVAGHPSYELADGSWREIGYAFRHEGGFGPLIEARGVDCVDPSYCVFGDGFGIEVRNQGVTGLAVFLGCCDGAQAVSCANRSYCAVVVNDVRGVPKRTHFLNGAADRRNRRLTRDGHPGVPMGIACFAGPVCIGVTNARGFVGS